MSSLKTKVIKVAAVVAIAGGAYTIGMANAGAAVKPIASAAPTLYSADTVSSIYSSTVPAVVEIDVTQSSGSGYFSQMQQGQGSGFLIDSQGHILTNNHVVDGATSVKVILNNGNTVDATVAGTDSIDDLAVVTVDPSVMKGVTPLQFVDSSTLKPGQMAVAIGTPYGLQDTITVGIISGLNRTVVGSGMTGLLQTDAAINPGNSGGPLLDVNGSVMGINTAVEGMGADGIGFAVPSNVAQKALPSLIAGKQVSKPFLGISGTALTQSLATSLNLSVNQGVYVVSVTSGSPAEKAGLKAGGSSSNNTPGVGGDVITAVDGNSVKAVQDLSNYFATKNVGDTVTLTVLRAGGSISVKVTLAAWPASTVTPQAPQTPQNPFPRIPGHGFGRGSGN